MARKPQVFTIEDLLDMPRNELISIYNRNAERINKQITRAKKKDRAGFYDISEREKRVPILGKGTRARRRDILGGILSMQEETYTGRELQTRKEMRDTIADMFGLQRVRKDTVTRFLEKFRGKTREEIEARLDLYKKQFPNAKITPEKMIQAEEARDKVAKAYSKQWYEALRQTAIRLGEPWDYDARLRKDWVDRARNMSGAAHIGSEEHLNGLLKIAETLTGDTAEDIKRDVLDTVFVDEIRGIFGY